MQNPGEGGDVVLSEHDAVICIFGVRTNRLKTPRRWIDLRFATKDGSISFYINSMEYVLEILKCLLCHICRPPFYLV